MTTENQVGSDAPRSGGVHHAVPTKSVNKIQARNLGCGTNDGVMVGCHLIKAGPGAARIYFGFRQTRYAIGGAGQNLFHKARIKLSLESRSLFRVVPRQQNSFALATEMKTGRHIDDHGKPLRKTIEWFGGNELASQGFDWQLRAGEPGYLRGPRASGVDDDPR